jgi:hypothetical protein
LGGSAWRSLTFTSRISNFGVMAGMEQLFKSLTDKEVNDYKQSSTSLINLRTLAAGSFRQSK